MHFMDKINGNTILKKKIMTTSTLNRLIINQLEKTCPDYLNGFNYDSKTISAMMKSLFAFSIIVLMNAWIHCTYTAYPGNLT